MRGTEAWTWLEVPVVGSGWVIVDPTPDAVTGSSAPTPEPAESTPTTVPTPRSYAIARPTTTGAHPLAPPVLPGAQGHAPSGWGPAILVGSMVLFVAVALLGVLAAERRRRLRSARKSDDAGELAVGAWLELLDGLERAGMRPDPAATSSEVAHEAGAHFGSSIEGPVALVGTLSDRALFDRRGVVDLADAHAAWRLQGSATRFALGTLDRRQRLRARVTLRASKLGRGAPRPPERIRGADPGGSTRPPGYARTARRSAGGGG